jgi:hypothetical protein
MTPIETNQITYVLEHVRHWPAPMRLNLVRRILETLETPMPELPSTERPRGPTAAEIAAMFKADKPAPDDATVKQWIDEHRMEKYGTRTCCLT